MGMPSSMTRVRLPEMPLMVAPGVAVVKSLFRLKEKPGMEFKSVLMEMEGRFSISSLVMTVTLPGASSTAFPPLVAVTIISSTAIG